MYGGPYWDEKILKWFTIILQIRVNPKTIHDRINPALPGIFKGDLNFERKIIWMGDKKENKNKPQ